MSVPKATLPFGPEAMLQRVVRIVSEVVPPENVIVATSAEIQLPSLSDEVTIVEDRQSNTGPIEGLASGLSCLPTGVDAAFVTGCDTPLLNKEFISKLLDLLDDYDGVVPREGEFFHPLVAVYHRRILPLMESRKQAGQLSLHGLIAQCNILEIPVDQLREVDPDLNSLMNQNTLEEYKAALDLAGYPFTL